MVGHTTFVFSAKGTGTIGDAKPYVQVGGTTSDHVFRIGPGPVRFYCPRDTLIFFTPPPPLVGSLAVYYKFGFSCYLNHVISKIYTVSF